MSIKEVMPYFSNFFQSTLMEALLMLFLPILIGLIVKYTLGGIIKVLIASTIGLNREGSKLISTLTGAIGIVVTLKLYGVNIF